MSKYTELTMEERLILVSFKAATLTDRQRRLTTQELADLLSEIGELYGPWCLDVPPADEVQP